VEVDVALSLHKRKPATPVSRDLQQISKELGVVLKPMHPGAKDTLLVPYFIVDVSDSADAKRVIARFQRNKATEAAYLKPPDEMP
jgi:hypothetical protein